MSRATSNKFVKNSMTEIKLERQSMQGVTFGARPRSGLPRTSPQLPTDIVPIVQGCPADLRKGLGKNIHSVSFPYDKYCESDGLLRETEYNLVTLENSRFRVVICPDLGGRIISFVDHQAGGELLFQPPMFLLRTIGLAGAWFVGGLEVNPFRLGHLVSGMNRVHTQRLQLRSGIEAVRFGATDELAGCSYTCTVALLPDRVALRMELTNHQEKPWSGYYWTNIAVPAHPWMHLVYPEGPILHHSMGKAGFSDEQWPNLHGFDCRRWLMHREIISAYSYKPSGDWMGSCDLRDQRTFAHRALRADCAGRKLWSLGCTDQDRVWFDHGVGEPNMGSYVEIQSGRCRTQLEADLLPGYSTTAWTEEITGMRWTPPGSDVGTEYRNFSQAVEATLDASTAIRDASFWEVVGEPETLVAADARLDLSHRIVSAPGTLSDAQVEHAVRASWVGGQAWIDRLTADAKRGVTSPWRELALAAARTDQAGAADPVLIKLAAGKDIVAGWAALIVARDPLCAVGAKAHKLLTKAAQLIPNDPAPHLALAEFNLARLKGDEAAVNAKHTTVRRLDDAAAIQAEGAFQKGQWDVCRKHLERNFAAVGEGQIRLWLMRKECDIIEAMTLFKRDRDVDGALRLLHEGARLRPQFGLGRDEAQMVHDVTFYRWALLTLSGRTQAAALAASNILRNHPWPATMDAAYALRVATLTGSSCLETRRTTIATWNQDACRDPRLANGAYAPVQAGGQAWKNAGPSPTAVTMYRTDLLVRQAVLEACAGSCEGFTVLKQDRLYLHRAAIERWLTVALAAHQLVSVSATRLAGTRHKAARAS